MYFLDYLASFSKKKSLRKSKLTKGLTIRYYRATKPTTESLRIVHSNVLWVCDASKIAIP